MRTSKPTGGRFGNRFHGLADRDWITDVQLDWDHGPRRLASELGQPVHAPRRGEDRVPAPPTRPCCWRRAASRRRCRAWTSAPTTFDGEATILCQRPSETHDEAHVDQYVHIDRVGPHRLVALFQTTAGR